MIDHISKHLEVHQKYSARRRIFNPPLRVWKCGQTQSFMFDILRPNEQNFVHQTKEQKKCFKLLDRIFDGFQILSNMTKHNLK